MDLMTDNEIEGVLGHELGHVSLGALPQCRPPMPHWRLAMRFSATSGRRSAAFPVSLGDLAEGVITRRFLAVRSLMR